MWLEQSDNDEYFQKKKEKKEQSERLDFFEAKKLQRETQDLLWKLARQISDEFWIDIHEAQNLISWSTLWELWDLKSSLRGTAEGFNVWKLKDAINAAKSQIEDLSKNKIEDLKKSVDRKTFSPESHEYNFSKKIVPSWLRQKAYKPQNYSDELIGIGVWFIDSSEAVILFTYSLAKWVLLTPYHIYLIIIWKSSYNIKDKL